MALWTEGSKTLDKNLQQSCIMQHPAVDLVPQHNSINDQDLNKGYVHCTVLST